MSSGEKNEKYVCGGKRLRVSLPSDSERVWFLFPRHSSISSIEKSPFPGQIRNGMHFSCLRRGRDATVGVFVCFERLLLLQRAAIVVILFLRL